MSQHHAIVAWLPKAGSQSKNLCGGFINLTINELTLALEQAKASKYRTAQIGFGLKFEHGSNAKGVSANYTGYVRVNAEQAIESTKPVTQVKAVKTTRTKKPTVSPAVVEPKLTLQQLMQAIIDLQASSK